MFLKIMPKLVFKTVIDDYNFNFKLIINNYSFNLKKLKNVVIKTSHPVPFTTLKLYIYIYIPAKEWVVDWTEENGVESERERFQDLLSVCYVPCTYRKQARHPSFSLSGTFWATKQRSIFFLTFFFYLSIDPSIVRFFLKTYLKLKSLQSGGRSINS